jgi:glutathione S-transferase
MKLYASPRSPYAQKVRIMFAEKGIPYTFAEVRASAPEVGEANPLAKIPVLVRDDGRSLYDSTVIVEYLDGLAPQTRLIPQDFEARIEVKRWEALANGVMDATVEISHDLRHPEPQQKGAEYRARQQRKIDAALVAMERDLGERQFCHGDSFTVADVACGAALAYLDQTLPDSGWRAKHPKLARHADRLGQRPSFSNV